MMQEIDVVVLERREEEGQLGGGIEGEKSG